MKKITLVALFLLSFNAKAGEFISEIGGGYLIPRYTSYLELPECKQAVVINPVANPRNTPILGNSRISDIRDVDSYSCGGHGPVFVGWPVAYEWDNGRGRIRLGLFHMSHWFDNSGETQFTCICSSYTIKWGSKNK